MENILNNTAIIVGNYNDVPTTLTSLASVVTLVKGLSIVKSADKEVWADGELTYTIKVDNQTTEDFKTPVITDVLDGTQVSFVADSVTIDGVKATSDEYSYDEESNTLTINLADIAPSGTKTVTFQVIQKV